MLVAEIAGIKAGDFVVDLCAAPGGKTHCGGRQIKWNRQGEFQRCQSEKVELIQENVTRMGFHNIEASVKDATVFDSSIMVQADVVIAMFHARGLE